MISSGRHRAQIVPLVVRLVPVDVRALGVSVAEIEQIAIGRGAVYVCCHLNLHRSG